jgi:hypothetical protein
MRNYITCTRRKGAPRVAVDVCRACRYRIKCVRFIKYRSPQLFPD